MKGAVLVVFAVLACAYFTQATITWEEWKQQYGKRYATRFEDAERRSIFNANLLRIDALNKMSRTANFSMNKFGDLTAEEFATHYLSPVEPVRDPKIGEFPLFSDEIVNALPTSFDWREKGAVTGVKNQGQCGSCWSFSTTGNVEGQWFLAGNKLVGLSEQNLVDCDHECIIYDGEKSCDAGCNGGLMPAAFEYIMSNGGIDTEASYPYEAVDGNCRFKNSTVGAKITNYTMISKNETQMAAFLVQNGPISIAVDAEVWQFYVFGILDIPCGTSLDHGVLIVGFGVGEDPIFQTVDFWTIKNSWGADWGESGYIRIERGVGECGCNLYACSSIV